MAPRHTEHRTLGELGGGASIIRQIFLLPYESVPLKTNPFDRRFVEFSIGCNFVELQKSVGDSGCAVRKPGEVAFIQGWPGLETEFVKLAPLQQVATACVCTGENLRLAGSGIAS